MEVNASLGATQYPLTIIPKQRDPQRQPAQAPQRTTELPPAEAVRRRPDPKDVEQAERFRQQQQGFAQPSSHARTAIATYQSLQSAQQRSEIQQMLGIDTFA